MKIRSDRAKVDLRTPCEHTLPTYHLWEQVRKEVSWEDEVRATTKGGPRRIPVEIDKEMKAAAEAYLLGTDTADKAESGRNRPA